MESRDAGAVVAGRYRLEHRLGEGGMGDVWAATHQVTDKPVALKFLVAASEEARERFLREAKAATRVGHPNVVPVHDVIELDDGTLVMVMDLLSGETLRDRLEREAPLGVEATAALLLPVLSAVGTAHQAGVVHRDLKPENIFITAGEEPKVLDFGIAKVTEPDEVETGLTNTGALLGTPHYMSPEQVFGEKDVDARADVWSLGVILYECLAGERPFEGSNPGQVMKAVLIGEYAPFDPDFGVPEEIVALVNEMLQQRRRERLPDLVAVYDALSAHTEVEAAPFSRATGLIQSIPPSVDRAEPVTLDTGEAWDELASLARESRVLHTAEPVATVAQEGRKRRGTYAAALAVAAVVGGGLFLLTRPERPPEPIPAVVQPAEAPPPVVEPPPPVEPPPAVTAEPTAEPTADPSSQPTSAPVAAAHRPPPKSPAPAPAETPKPEPTAEPKEALPHGVHGEVPF